MSAEDVLRRNGFRQCDIAACNCGSWHAPPRREDTNIEAFKALLSLAESMARLLGADFSAEEFKDAREAIARMGAS